MWPLRRRSTSPSTRSNWKKKDVVVEGMVHRMKGPGKTRWAIKNDGAKVKYGC